MKEKNLVQSASTDIIEALRNILPLTKYGTGLARSFEHLIKEIELGESNILFDNQGRPLRQINVSLINVTYLNKKLVETKQITSQGVINNRRYEYVSEKAFQDEPALVCAVRGLREELDLIISPERLVYREERQEERMGPSYPGLKTRYNFSEYSLTLKKEEYQFCYVEVNEDDTTSIFRWKENPSRILSSPPSDAVC